MNKHLGEVLLLCKNPDTHGWDSKHWVLLFRINTSRNKQSPLPKPDIGQDNRIKRKPNITDVWSCKIQCINTGCFAIHDLFCLTIFQVHLVVTTYLILTLCLLSRLFFHEHMLFFLIFKSTFGKHSKISLTSKNIYFLRAAQRGWDRESYADLLPRWPQWPGLDWAKSRSQELFQVSLWYQDLAHQTLSPPMAAFPRPLKNSWVGIWAARTWMVVYMEC